MAILPPTSRLAFVESVWTELDGALLSSVVLIWMLLVHTVGGLSPWAWHLSNILLHVAATYLVFRLCRRLTGSDIGAGVAAAVFAVHPIHVDAVTWVSASCELLFTLFTLGSIMVLLGDNTAAERPQVWASAALYGAGLFAKETGVALVLILIVIAWVRFTGPSQRRTGPAALVGWQSVRCGDRDLCARTVVRNAPSGNGGGRTQLGGGHFQRSVRHALLFEKIDHTVGIEPVAT